jgi:anti-sigma factor RsiW
MVCKRFQTDGMRLLDCELSAEEKAQYETHVRECEDCRRELKELGKIVELSEDLKLRSPDEQFWAHYWDSLFRRMERRTGFFFIIAGILSVSVFALYKAVTSPQFLTVQGIASAAVLLGVIVVFLSVARERYHESKNDPYKGVEQ